MVKQFKQEIISGFWSCYKNNSGRGWKKFVLVCHEAVFVQIFRNYITKVECLGSEEWAVKYYENNEAVSSDICTRSEGGWDVEGNKGCRW